jgi:Lon protease-like protein
VPTAAVSAARLPLFPLRAVLFPGGPIRLRIFERRYLDMIRDCARDGSGFGVCLILEGAQAGAPARPAAVGTEARIEDFDSTPEGLLGITARGGRRFHVERTHVRDSGLVVGQVRWLPEAPAQPVPAEHGLLAALLGNLLGHFGELPDDAVLLDEAGWVSWRLAEILPLQQVDRQVLLGIDDGCDRLERLAQWLPRLQGEAPDR